MIKGTTIELDAQTIQLKVEMDNIVESIKGIDYELLELEALLKAQIAIKGTF